MRLLSQGFSRAALVIALVLVPLTARAAVNGNIAGIVTDQATGKALAGVTVTVSGPKLIAEQTEFTDSSGRYIITEIPPGEYVVRFYYSNIKVERIGVLVSADKTLTVSAGMPTQQATKQVYVIRERAPTVDVANTQIQTQVTNELVRNTPVRGRTYESVLTLAPGATTDAVGFSFNGATGPENNFLIDGFNTTNPAFGLVGTKLSSEFIAETNIITGGYNAEYGRATGGVVNVITKSGSNEFHGGAWFYFRPFQLDPERVARAGEAIVTQTKYNYAFDFGFDIGGPILKDKIWFYVGFHPQFDNFQTSRILRRRTATAAGLDMYSGTYPGDIDDKVTCPSWLANKSLCPAPVPANGPFKTEDIGKVNKFESNARLFNWITKFDFALNENNRLTVQYIGSPSTWDGYGGNPNNANSLGVGFNGLPTSANYKNSMQVHDVSLRFVSKLLDRKLQIDISGAYHHEDDTNTVPDQTKSRGRDNRSGRSLAQYEGDDPTIAEKCKRSIVGLGGPKDMMGNATNNFNPCPVSAYGDGGGFGFLNQILNQRISVQAAATLFAKLAGTHAFKLGFDFEDNMYTDRRFYTGPVVPNEGDPDYKGGGSFTITNTQVRRVQFGSLEKDAMGKEVVKFKDGFKAQTATFNYSLYLRDSWNMSFLPGMTLNLGVRWEGQEVKGADGKTYIGVYDNFAPRLGLIYDFTQKGRSKIFASYGQFYESIPLDINDRQFSGEGLIIQSTPLSQCPQDMNGRIDLLNCKYKAPTPSQINGGTYGDVSASLKGQYSNEVVAGLEYDVGLDLVLGAKYIHRDLGRVIEDISPDGGHTYIIANPGEVDKGTVDKLSKDIEKTSDPEKKEALQQKLSLYQSVGTFEKPKRDYNALVITANKRFSYNFLLLANYTYSRTLGNYPGLFSPSNGQLDPNISSQYDLRELLVNRNGPLPNDRPHNFKLTGAYTIPFGANGINIGLTFSVISGRPIEVLGGHPIYGARETFILPRGSGGRTPTLTSFDLQVAYNRQFGKLLRLDVYWDTFNVFNQRGVSSVDDEYALGFVQPIKDGTYADLAGLKDVFTGAAPRLNPNYGQATGFQAPLSMRFGLRVSF